VHGELLGKAVHRRQKWHSGYHTKKEAERARVDLLAKLDRGEYVEPTRQTMGGFMTSWLESVATTVRPATVASYRRIVSSAVVPRIGSVPLQKLRAPDLNRLYAELLASGGRRRHGLSAKSVRNVHIVVHRALADAVRWGDLSRNPADNADAPQVQRKEMRTWSAGETRTFLDSVTDDPVRAAWVLVATTGARRGEVLGLRWGDLDLDNGRAAVVQQLTTVNNQLVFVPPKTAKGRRSLALDRYTVDVLREHRKRQLEQRMALGSGWPGHDLVFTRPDGEPVHPDSFTRWFVQRARAAGLPVIRVHDLRHGWATLALEAGVHPKVVSEQLGHSTVAITLDLYSHVSPTMAADAVERVSGAVFGDR